MSSWSRLKRGGLAVAFYLLIGGLAVYSQTGGQNRPDPLPSSSPPVTTVRKLSFIEPPVVIVAPSEVRATGGRGRLLLYDLNPSGERIDYGAKDSQKPSIAASFKEVEREYSWAVVTGVVKHKAICESANRSRFGYPNSPGFYRRVDLARQTRNPDGSWSSWTSVDATPTLRVLDNIPEQDEESIDLPLPGLVDPLPVLKNGKWLGANVERLVPRTKNHTHGHLYLDLRRMLGAVPAPPPQLPPELMLRSFDFSVLSGQTYRYRAHVVVDARPRYGRLTEVLGDWSAPTEAVTVP
jgi:hypothetical protein